MDALIKKYSKPVVDMGMHRQGILAEQLNPYEHPKQILSPEKKLQYDLYAEVHNSNRIELLSILKSELKLLAPIVEKMGEDRAILSLVPHKSVSEAKTVKKLRKLPVKVKSKNVEADDSFQVPESVDIPSWLDQDGDGIISREEYQVLEREMVRSEKVEKQNRKNINAIITRETLREEKERNARQAESQLVERVKLQREGNKNDAEMAAKRKQARIDKQLQNQKAMVEELNVFKQKYQEMTKKSEAKEKERKLILQEKKNKKRKITKEKKEKLKQQVEAANVARKNKFDKVIKQRKIKEMSRKSKKHKEAEELAVLANARKILRKQKLVVSETMRINKQKEKKEKVEAKVIASNERNKLIEQEEIHRIQELSRDTKRKAMECVIRKKKKAEAAEQRAQMLIEISKKKDQEVEINQQKVKEIKIQVANKKKKSLFAQRLRSERNQRIRAHRHEVLRLKADADTEREERRRDHQRSLQSHRDKNRLESWKKIDLIKKNGNTISLGGVSPTRPKKDKKRGGGGAPSPRLFQPKMISPKRQEIEAKRKQKDGFRDTLNDIPKKPDLLAYQQTHEAISHLNHTNIQGSETLHSSFR